MRQLFLVSFLLLLPHLLLGQGRIPPECYLDQRNNSFNSCKYCHTSNQPGASNDDVDRQGAFPAVENAFLNVLDPARLDSLVPPATIPADLTDFLSLDNYHLALQARGGTAAAGSGAGRYKYFPDLDPEQTGPDGFANNGWRAFKWKPFELAWPKYLGRIQQNWIRLPDKFRRNASGAYDLEIYKQNLDLLVEVVSGRVREGTYLGMAADEPIIPYRFPGGTEVLHYLYYLDPTKPGMKAVRIKEVRWNIKSVPPAYNQDYFGYVSNEEKKYSLTYREGGPQAAAAYGMVYNEDGWDLIGFLEEADGTLRPQTQEEMTQCLGCHSGRVGIPIDSHWQSLQRKLPGEAGWRLQDYQGIPDYYNAWLGRGEMSEIFENYFGDAARVPGNPDGTINFLPTPAEAEALTRRYYQIVQTQSFALGRDPKLENPGFLRAPGTTRFRAKEEQELWYPALDFSRFDLVVAPTAVVETEGVLPAQMRLFPNYPNPFNDGTEISFALPAAGEVELAVYGLNGQQISMLAHGLLPAGEHRVRWDGRDLQGHLCASGVYVCRLSRGEEVLTHKMLLLR